MDAAFQASYFVGDLIAPLGVGYLLRRTALARRNFDHMIEGSFVVLFPLLAIFSFWVLTVDWKLAWLPVFGVLLHIVPGVFSLGFSRRQCFNRADCGSFILAGMLSNLLTLGGISVFLLYGEQGFAYVQLTVLFQNVILFLFCFPLARYYALDSSAGTVSWAAVLFSRNQLTVVGMAVGLLLQYSGLPRPDFCRDLANGLLHLSAWMTLLPVGHSLDFTEIRQHWVAAAVIAVIKFVLTPLCIYGVASLVIHDPLMLHSLLILAAAPTAINAVLVVRLHDLNIHLVMAAFVFTTTVYLLLVYPCLYWLLS